MRQQRFVHVDPASKPGLAALLLLQDRPDSGLRSMHGIRILPRTERCQPCTDAIDAVHELLHSVRCMDLAPFRTAVEDALRARDWSLSRLGRETGIQPSVLSRWLSEGGSRPSPRNLEKLSAGLGVDYEQMMQLCGYLPSEPAVQVDARRQAVRDQLDRWLTAVGPDYEDEFWQSLKNHGDSTVRLIGQVRTAVSDHEQTAVNAAVSGRSKRGRPRRTGGNGALSADQHAAREVLGIGRATSKRRLAA